MAATLPSSSPEFLAQSSSGRIVYAATEDDRLEWIELLLVASLEFTTADREIAKRNGSNSSS